MLLLLLLLLLSVAGTKCPYRPLQALTGPNYSIIQGRDIVKIAKLAFIALLSASLAACNSSSDSKETPPPSGGGGGGTTTPPGGGEGGGTTPPGGGEGGGTTPPGGGEGGGTTPPGGGEGDGTTPPPGGGTTPPPPSTSLDSVPEAYRESTSAAKIWHAPYPFDEFQAEKHEEEYEGVDRMMTIDGQAEKYKTYNLSALPNGISELAITTVSYERVYNSAVRTASGTLLVYQQPYSLVTGITWTSDTGNKLKEDELNIFIPTAISRGMLGFITPDSAFTSLIDAGSVFNYSGIALDGENQGTLHYTMDFGQQKGSGSITGFTRTGLISLESASLNEMNYIYGDVSTEKNVLTTGSTLQYYVSFFGPNAEEITGYLFVNTGDHKEYGPGIIFGGTR